MAWVDDRIWCHPKFTGLSAEAFRVYVHGLAYSAGLGTCGVLTYQQQQLIGSTVKIRRELIRTNLWQTDDQTAAEHTTKSRRNRGQNTTQIAIHDWAEHNGKRDDRRAADRERKRLARAKERETSAGQDADKTADSPPDGPQDRPQPVLARGAAHVDGSEGSDGSEKPPLPLPEAQDPPGGTDGDQYGPQPLNPLAVLAAAAHDDDIAF